MVIQVYAGVRLLRITDIDMSASPGVSQLLASAVWSLITDPDILAGATQSIVQHNQGTDPTLTELIAVVEQRRRIQMELLTVLHGNAFAKHPGASLSVVP
jgi:hypothetical protein